MLESRAYFTVSEAPTRGRLLATLGSGLSGGDRGVSGG
jgi:hypothetical protein